MVIRKNNNSNTILFKKNFKLQNHKKLHVYFVFKKSNFFLRKLHQIEVCLNFNKVPACYYDVTNKCFYRVITAKTA